MGCGAGCEGGRPGWRSASRDTSEARCRGSTTSICTVVRDTKFFHGSPEAFFDSVDIFPSACRAAASRVAQAAAVQGTGARQVEQLRKAALPLLRDAVAASPNDVLLTKALETVQGKPASSNDSDESDDSSDTDE